MHHHRKYSNLNLPLQNKGKISSKSTKSSQQEQRQTSVNTRADKN